ncbi:alpha/beta fold hydrolase [Pseudonocardia pini]|uniref:alpha/beta fold hydrolase n=1 Tax=Pseudonocardia pini TaxID=2758030 RepID=UPI0015EFE867|nr:alpha/beta hydrolase [Pseudonocardia pini]
MVSRRLWQALGVAGGIAGAAGAAVGVGVATHKRHEIAKDRRRLAGELDAGGGQPGAQPPRTSSSVMAEDGIRLACEELAPHSGAPALTVVLVHGFALDRRTWHFQAEELPRMTGPAVRTILYDQRSHGRSERAPRASCTIEQLGHDLDSVIRSLAPEGPLVLIGHSMGGMTLMALAERHPEVFTERVLGVGLVSTSAGELGTAGLSGSLLSRFNPLTRTVGALARLQPKLVEGGRRALGDLIWAITRRFAFGDQKVDPALVDLVDTMISANAVDALTDFVDTVGTHDRIAALPAFATCEVLVVAGTADQVIPYAHGELIAAELPKAEFVELEGVGHMPMLERHAEVEAAVEGLIRRSAERIPRRAESKRRRA